MPLRIAAGLSRPVTPYLAFIMMAAKLLNNFPQDLATLVPEDHRKLRATFNHGPIVSEFGSCSVTQKKKGNIPGC